MTDYKVEQRVIDAVKEMRANGLGLRAIARCLTQMQVPTKCRGKKWHPETVKRILTTVSDRVPVESNLVAEAAESSLPQPLPDSRATV